MTATSTSPATGTTTGTTTGRRGRRAAPLAALLAVLLAPLLLAGCGGSDEALPACADVWVLGQTVPSSYAGCQRDIVIDASKPDECTDGRRLVAYDDRLFAYLGEPAESLEGDAGEKAYDKADELCSTPLEQIAAAEARRTDPTAALRSWLRAYAAGNGTVACRLQTEAYTKDAIAHAIAGARPSGDLEKGAGCTDLVAAVGPTLKKLDLGAVVLTRLDEGAQRTRVSMKLPGRPATTYDLTFDDDRWVVDLPASRA